MTTITTVTRLLPAYWASYYINGDASGLTDEEQARADAWLDGHSDLQCVDCGEPEFRWGSIDCPAELGGDYCEFVFYTQQEQGSQQ